LNSFLPGAPSSLNSLSQIGINFQKDGTLQLDNAKLTSVINDSEKDLGSLFATNGFAVKLDKLVDGMLKNNGLIDGRLDGISDTIKDIGKQREMLGRRLEDVEKRYRTQFTALDTMIASMTQTSTFLQQQLSNLPKASSGN
jgi:flagellar hook-associated protein 2